MADSPYSAVSNQSIITLKNVRWKNHMTQTERCPCSPVLSGTLHEGCRPAFEVIFYYTTVRPNYLFSNFTILLSILSHLTTPPFATSLPYLLSHLFPPSLDALMPLLPILAVTPPTILIAHLLPYLSTPVSLDGRTNQPFSIVPSTGRLHS
jgi:hypothetical protein